MLAKNLFNNHYKKIKKDYQRKNLSNPFFKQRQGARSWTSFWPVILGGLVILFSILIWFFGAAPLWAIQRLTVEGLSLVPSQELENIVWKQTLQPRYLFFKEANIFLFNQADLTSKIMANYNFAGVKVERKLPHTLRLIISERPYAFIFQEGSAFFYASPDAYIIKEQAVSEETKKKYFILENRSARSLIDERNKLALSAEYLSFIFKLDSLIKLKPDLPIEKFIIDQEFNTVKLKIVKGPTVYFNVKGSAENQVNYLALVKKEKIKDNFSKTNYIDLRYGDRIYINPDFK
ncbi:MAG: hypothetical protein WC863_04225 [Patescibacteria group bacterium]